MKQILVLLLLITFIQCTGNPKTQEKLENQAEIAAFIREPPGDLPVTSFPEIWGYVIAGQEAALRRGLPITDVGYFGAEVDTYGKLSKVPNRNNLSSFPGRVHLTVTCFSYPLTYFVLLPGSQQRRELIADLVAASANFDGLNIDFENIPVRAEASFISFIRELQRELPKDKIFSICLYGRIRANPNDVYDYIKYVPYVDKVFVMAYDEHWSTSRAGPVSSIGWSRNVAEYSLRVVGHEKLVMGIPFYGRAWVDHNHHRALVYSSTERLINTHNVKDIRRDNGIPTFDYTASVNVKVFYEDEYSLSTRFEMYKSMGVRAIGFWRVGQETPRAWNILEIE
ncbi:MAG: glycosyl hydrolase family 18 protein [Treponema sp.]|nr:glycosyl hydrolase family 18 protein [Treponema sp.]